MAGIGLPCRLRTMGDRYRIGETTVIPVTPETQWEQSESWSRDGSLIAVSEPGQTRVVRMGGGEVKRIAVEGGSPSSLGWTASDEGIFYIGTEPAGDGMAINVVEVDGNNNIQLTPDSTEATDLQRRFYHAVASSDGTRLAYIQRSYLCSDEGCSQEPERLLVMDLENSSVVELSTPTRISGVRPRVVTRRRAPPIWLDRRRRVGGGRFRVTCHLSLEARTQSGVVR